MERVETGVRFWVIVSVPLGEGVGVRVNVLIDRCNKFKNKNQQRIRKYFKNKSRYKLRSQCEIRKHNRHCARNGMNGLQFIIIHHFH